MISFVTLLPFNKMPHFLVTLIPSNIVPYFLVVLKLQMSLLIRPFVWPFHFHKQEIYLKYCKIVIFTSKYWFAHVIFQSSNHWNIWTHRSSNISSRLLLWCSFQVQEPPLSALLAVWPTGTSGNVSIEIKNIAIHVYDSPLNNC